MGRCLLLMLTAIGSGALLNGCGASDSQSDHTVNASSVAVPLECHPPMIDAATTRYAGIPVEQLGGSYELTAVVAQGRERDSMAWGELHLQRRSRQPAEPGSPGAVLYGWSNIDLTTLASVTIVTPVSSTDPARPGVLVAHDSREPSVTLVFGASTASDNVAIHAGVVFHVLEATRQRLSGWWWVGGLKLPVTSGFFCAVRVG